MSPRAAFRLAPCLWLFVALSLPLVAGPFTGSAAQAQAQAIAPPSAAGAPAANAGTAQAPPPPGAPGAPSPASPAPLLGPSGGRIGAGEVAIVGGNVASARERALADAVKQAVDQAITALIPDGRATQPKTVSQVLGRARGYVRRYRTLEEGERGRGLYGVRIEADIDEMALQRAFDRPTPSVGCGAAAAAPAGGPPAALAPSYLVVAAGVPEAATAAHRAFAGAGARVQAAPADLVDPTKAVDAAARAGLANVAFVSGTATSDGKVRGPGIESVGCVFDVRVLAAGSGLAVANESESQRAFADRADSARADCFRRAAAAAIPRVVPAAGVRAAPDMRTIVIDADVVEPGAIPALVRQLRGIGSVSGIEVRRVNSGHAELWVRSRLAGPALGAALGRDAGGPLSVTSAVVSGDLIRLRARLREAAAPVAAPPGVAPAAAATPAAPAAGTTPGLPPKPVAP
ncbi:MAG: hypothetical protein ABUS79_03280 [Pseudomonadota bacterium]